jgi:tetratricopeptide (TPR) repeat protein
MAKTTKDTEIKELVEDLIKKATQKTKAKVHDEAAELLEQVLELEPENTRALDLLGFVKWALGDIGASEEINRRSLAIKPLGHYARKGLGVCLADQGKIDEAIPEFYHAMALKPLWVDPVHDLAVCLFRAGRFEQSIRWFEQCLEMDPKLAPKVTPLLEKARAEAAKGA